MSDGFKIFVIDDDPMIGEVLSSILEPDCLVTSFASSEDCAARLEQDKPDMFLLDIGLPGMNGYEFCRLLKDDPATSRIPLTFISSHDTIEARLQGYDSGGEDFIVKPFAPDEVLRKVRVAQSITRNLRSQQEQAEAAEYLSTLALASMDESGLVLQFMSKLIPCEHERDVADGLLELLQRFRLTGVVQVRVAQRTLTLGASGPDIPLEVAVIDHVRTLGRIFEFRTRGVHNFERVTLLVNNLPVADPDLCGRLRDHLSVAAQGADARLQGIETEEANRRSKAGILVALQEIGVTMSALGESQASDRARGAEIINSLQDRLVKSFVTLGLTADQERFLEGLVNGHMEELAALHDRGSELQAALASARRELEQLARQA